MLPVPERDFRTSYLDTLPYHQRSHTKRHATQHGCLTSSLGDGDKRIEIVHGEKKIFYTGPTTAAKAEQKYLVPA
jgi:hypothetical protein